MREFPAFCLLFMRKKANDRGNKYIRQILTAFRPLRNAPFTDNHGRSIFPRIHRCHVSFC